MILRTHLFGAMSIVKLIHSVSKLNIDVLKCGIQFFFVKRKIKL